MALLNNLRRVYLKVDTNLTQKSFDTNLQINQ